MRENMYCAKISTFRVFYMQLPHPIGPWGSTHTHPLGASLCLIRQGCGIDNIKPLLGEEYLIASGHPPIGLLATHYQAC